MKRGSPFLLSLRHLSYCQFIRRFAEGPRRGDQEWDHYIRCVLFEIENLWFKVCATSAIIGQESAERSAAD
jgi:hypothetical protein